MSYEVELKAWVDNKNELTQMLNSIAVYGRSFHKSDTYYRKDNLDNLAYFTVRIRKDGSENYVTYKEKTLQENIEVNKETEFSVTDTDAFTSLLLKLGMYENYTKSKVGKAYKLNDVLCELCTIETLGDFIELEIILDSNDPILVKNAKAKLYTTLENLGVSVDKIEVRHYSELLKLASQAK